MEHARVTLAIPVASVLSKAHYEMPVLRREGMSVDAVGDHPLSPALEIRPMVHWLKMAGIGAAAVTAEVVEFEVGMDWPTQMDVGQPMDKVPTEQAIPEVAQRPAPLPATIAVLD